MPLPLTISCSSKIQIGLTFLVLAHPGSPGQRAVKWVCVCYMAHVCKGHKRAMSEEMAAQLSVPLYITNYQDTCTHTQLFMVLCLLQADNHASTPPTSFFTGQMPFLLPSQQHQSTEGMTVKQKCLLKLSAMTLCCVMYVMLSCPMNFFVFVNVRSYFGKTCPL